MNFVLLADSLCSVNYCQLAIVRHFIEVAQSVVVPPETQLCVHFNCATAF